MIFFLLKFFHLIFAVFIIRPFVWVFIQRNENVAEQFERKVNRYKSPSNPFEILNNLSLGNSNLDGLRSIEIWNE